MDTRAIEARRRREAGEQGYVVFLILHVLCTWWLLYQRLDADAPLVPLDSLLHVVAAIVILSLLAAYTFSANRISFRTTLSLTIIWFVVVGGWVFRWEFSLLPGAAQATTILLYVAYALLFFAGLSLKRGPTGIRDPM
jgi:hypothetical protein